MIILGIETSCDETAAAVWKGDALASNIVASQEVHKKYGGVVPELASRAHVKNIVPIVDRALAEAEVGREALDAVAVTYGPGLAGSLLVGLNFAKATALALQVPFVGINHMEGHIFSTSVLERGPEPPFLSLVISGGHTQLMLVEVWGRYRMLARTRDDAVGEAFDKVAKMLELPYPGGPAIDRLAREGDSEYLRLPKARFKDGSLDFSYSGLKTAVLYHLRSLSEAERKRHKADLAASFQAAAVEVLVENSVRAIQEHGLERLAVAGGVACNSLLRRRFEEESRRHEFELFVPPPILCTDNAAMIARAGLFYLNQGRRSAFDLSPEPTLSF